jgi:hypothetical protein
MTEDRIPGLRAESRTQDLPSTSQEWVEVFFLTYTLKLPGSRVVFQNVGHWQFCRFGPHRPRRRGGLVGHGGPQKYVKLKYSVDSFGLESILVTEVCSLDPCFEFWE